MSKKALMLASVASMIDQFNMHNIQLLLDNGYQVDVACNCKVGNTISDEKVKDLIKLLSDKGVPVFHLPIPRKITDIKGIIDSLTQVKKMCKKNHYALLHCHSPIGSVVARIAAKNSRKKYGTKAIYTAHGFHFYKGAPSKNWLLYYPIEKILSYFTDVLITINKEDYTLAQKKMKAKKIVYVPGVGIDINKFSSPIRDINIRKKLCVDRDDFLIVSVGELSHRKNQIAVLKAIARIKHDSPNLYKRIQYIIIGQGELEKTYQKFIDVHNLNKHIHLLGFRTDVSEILKTSDLFVFPSLQEGLPVALMEAMACGLPCAVSRIRGNVDLIENDVNGYLCSATDSDSFSLAISKLAANSTLRRKMGMNNLEKIRDYDISVVEEEMKNIYREVLL